MKILLLLWAFCLASPAFAITEAEAIANWDRSIKQLKVNALLARVDTSIPSGTSAANTFGNLAMKGTSVDSLALSTKGALTVAGKPLVIDIEAKLLKPSVIGAFGRFAKKAIPLLNTGVALYDLTNELSGWSVEKDADGKPKFQKTADGIECVANCFEYQIAYQQNTWHKTPQLAFQEWAIANNDRDNTYKFVSVNPEKTYVSGIREYRPPPAWGSPNQDIPVGKELWKRAIPPYNTATKVPATAEEWADEVAKKPYSPSLTKLVRDAIQSGEEIETAPPSATGPATTPGTTTTTTGTATDGTPTTTTTTTSNHFTYAGDNITHNTTSTTQTCTGAGSCSTSTTTTENQPSAEPVPTEPTPSQCEKNPDTIGCAKFGNPEDPQLPKTASPVSVELKHFSGTGACPNPLSFTLPTGTYAIAFNPICDQLIYLKALILALAGIMAAYILADSFKVG